jgi:hypothetical protein
MNQDVAPNAALPKKRSAILQIEAALGLDAPSSGKCFLLPAHPAENVQPFHSSLLAISLYTAGIVTSPAAGTAGSLPLTKTFLS